MTSVIFVCLGNICRSPLAEGIFLNLVEKRGLSPTYNIDSAGTASYHIGKRADPRSIAVGYKHNLHLPSRARQFTASDFDAFDVIIAMDSSNRRNILALARNAEDEAKVHKMRDFDPNGRGDVPDPYYGGDSGFDDVYAMLLRCCEGLLSAIETGNL